MDVTWVAFPVTRWLSASLSAPLRFSRMLAISLTPKSGNLTKGNSRETEEHVGPSKGPPPLLHSGTAGGLDGLGGHAEPGGARRNANGRGPFLRSDREWERPVKP